MICRSLAPVTLESGRVMGTSRRRISGLNAGAARAVVASSEVRMANNMMDSWMFGSERWELNFDGHV